jgi:hypothetical protein
MLLICDYFESFPAALIQGLGCRYQGNQQSTDALETGVPVSKV